MVRRGSLIREGKAKILYETDPPNPDSLIQFFKDDATAFNALKKGTIQGKGKINNTISALIFPWLTQQGIPTHFIEKLSDNEMLTKKLTIIPIEMVVRNRAAGSLCKRLGIEKGKPLTPPLVEYFYKSDELGDPLIGETHINYFKWATPSELSEMRELTLKVNSALSTLFDKIGLILVDFKLEFGKTKEGKIVLGDEFTPDGCRLWDKKTLEPMDKDRFRQDLGKVEESYQEVCGRVVSLFQTEGML
jgi:phosphoribosylaminoimidazole-succinocarboxamide synthase